MNTPHMLLVCAALSIGCGSGSGASTPTSSASAPAKKTEAKPEPEKVAYTCNVPQQHHCYTTKPNPAFLKGEEGGCIGTWSQGESCAKEKVVATCKGDKNEEMRWFYEGVKLDLAETSCTTFGGTFAKS